MAQVAQPVFSDLQDDRQRQLRVLRKMIRFAAFVSFPLMFGLSLVAEEFIVVTITEKWLGSAMLLRVLCIAAAFGPLSTVLSQYIVSRGRSGIYLGCTSVLCALLIVTKSMFVLCLAISFAFAVGRTGRYDGARPLGEKAT